MPRFAVTRSGSRAEIVFDDGGMNLLSSDALRELQGVIRSREDGEDSRVSLLLFRSGRPNLFAAGADMAEMRDFTPEQAAGFARLGQEVFDAIEKLPLLTVAAIDGDCFGGALDLALAFDIRIATPRARFAHPGARLGIATGFGGTSRWRKVLQRPAANALFIANRVFSAEEAERIGIVSAVTTDFEEAISRLGGADPRAVRLTKELAAHAPRLTRSQLQLLAERLGNLYFGN
ncbi:MAG TPA: enoyl-CoA hydratase/isomerase family protein [Thermoanaerobaculia bacterium]|nr:enoyl-CoA hydratase/isomerase family protein [Thermoanaerobaculia bacterium]